MSRLVKCLLSWHRLYPCAEYGLRLARYGHDGPPAGCAGQAACPKEGEFALRSRGTAACMKIVGDRMLGIDEWRYILQAVILSIVPKQTHRQLPQRRSDLVQLMPAMTMRLFSTGVKQKATTREIL